MYLHGIKTDSFGLAPLQLKPAVLFYGDIVMKYMLNMKPCFELTKFSRWLPHGHVFLFIFLLLALEF